MSASHKQIGGLDLNLLFAFDALLQYGSVTRAAQHLDVTQSAVSHSLRKLRTFFGDNLFVKGRDGVVPTDRAHLLAPAVRQIVGVAREALATVASFDPLTAHRTVTLCMSDMGEMSLLPIVVEELRKAAPLCTLRTMHLESPAIERALQTGEADMVLSARATLPQGILRQRIFTHTLSVIASPAYSSKGPMSLASYASMEHVAVASVRLDVSQRNVIWQKLKIAPRVYLITPHATVVPWIIARNPALIATVPYQLAQRFAQAGLVRILKTEFELPVFPIHQYWHRRLDKDQFGIWFRKFLRHTVRSHPELNLV